MIKHDCAAWSRTEMLDCPECETPAIPASSVVNGRPVWTEDDAEVWCPGCGCLLYVFLTGNCQGSQWCEARVSEYSGRDWRRAIEGVLGVDEVPDEHTPDFLAEAVLAQREIGNKRICQDERDVLGPACPVAYEIERLTRKLEIECTRSECNGKAAIEAAAERDDIKRRLRELVDRVEHCDGGECPCCGLEEPERHASETACPLGQHLADVRAAMEQDA